MLKKIFRICLIVLVSAGLLSAQSQDEPEHIKIIPEAIWANASGGGYWQTEVQVVAHDDGTELEAQFYYGGGSFRNVDLSVTLDQFETFKTSNILDYMGGIDTGYDYFNKVGALVIGTQGGAYDIHVNVRTWHSNGYAKSFKGMNWNEGLYINETVTDGIIMNLFQDADQRSSVAFFNVHINSITVDVSIVNSNGTIVGTPFQKTITGWDFQAFDPFAEAGLTDDTYSNHYVYISRATSSNNGDLFLIGASANNATNDPSAHVMQPWAIVI